MDISIIIPTYNRNSILYKNLAIAFIELRGMNCEVVVINDSKNNTVEIPQEWQSLISVHNNPKQGVASARNLGATLAKSDKIIFMDDDMIINRSAVERAVEYLDKNKSDCLNIDWVYPPELKAQLDDTQFGRYLMHYGFTTLRGWVGKDFAWRDNAVLTANGVTSQFLAMTKETFNRIGGYNEHFPFAGFEDYDFYIQMQKRGINAYLDTGTMILHNEEDRVQLDGWMQRKYRGGQTRRVAVNMGYKELETNYDNLKGKAYFILSRIEFMLKGVLRMIPNNKAFDSLYFRVTNILLGTNLYKGYVKEVV